MTCCAIITLWAADIFWRLVDMKCVKFARWVSVQCFIQDESSVDRDPFQVSEDENRRLLDPWSVQESSKDQGV